MLSGRDSRIRYVSIMAKIALAENKTSSLRVVCLGTWGKVPSKVATLGASPPGTGANEAGCSMVMHGEHSVASSTGRPDSTLAVSSGDEPICKSISTRRS